MELRTYTTLPTTEHVYTIRNTSVRAHDTTIANNKNDTVGFE